MPGLAWFVSIGKVFSLLGQCWLPLVLLFFLAAVCPAYVFPNLARGADAAVGLVEDVADAGGTVALAAKNLTLAVSNVALSLARNSMGLVDEAWSGVDLVDCTLDVTGGRYVVDSAIPDRRGDPESGELARTLQAVPTELSDEVWAAIRSISPRAPSASRLTARFNFSSRFFIWDWEIMLVDESYLALRVYYAALDFTVRWSNPLWLVTGADPGQELERITTRVNGAILGAVDAEVVRRPLTKDEVLRLPGVSPPWWYRLARMIFRQWDWIRFASGSRP